VSLPVLSTGPMGPGGAPRGPVGAYETCAVRCFHAEPSGLCSNSLSEARFEALFVLCDDLSDKLLGFCPQPAAASCSQPHPGTASRNQPQPAAASHSQPQPATATATASHSNSHSQPQPDEAAAISHVQPQPQPATATATATHIQP